MYVPPSHEPTFESENGVEASDMRILELEIDVGAAQVLLIYFSFQSFSCVDFVVRLDCL